MSFSAHFFAVLKDPANSAWTMNGNKVVIDTKIPANKYRIRTLLVFLYLVISDNYQVLSMESA